MTDDAEGPLIPRVASAWTRIVEPAVHLNDLCLFADAGGRSPCIVRAGDTFRTDYVEAGRPQPAGTPAAGLVRPRHAR